MFKACILLVCQNLERKFGTQKRKILSEASIKFIDKHILSTTLLSVNFKNNHFILINMSIASLFHQTALNLPDNVAIEFEDKRVTYREIDLIENKVANAFQSLGITKGDRVAQFIPNCLELVYSIVGNFKNGSIVVPMNVSFKEQNIQHILSDCGAKAVITDKERIQIVNN